MKRGHTISLLTLGAITLVGVIAWRIDDMMLSLVFRQESFSPFLFEDESCTVGGETQQMQAAVSAFEARLKAPHFRAGYDPSVALKGALGFGAKKLLIDRVSGQLLLVHDRRSVWVLVTLDLIGLPSPLSESIRREVEEVIKEHSPPVGCVVVNVVASHTHSGPDFTGLWGGVASGLDPDENRKRLLHFGQEPLLESLKLALRRASLRARPVALEMHHAHLPSNRGALVGDLRRGGVAEHLGNEDLVSIQGRSGRESLFDLWLWNAQAATEPVWNPEVPGDFPERVREPIGSRALFLPGVLVGEYPVESSGWLQELAAQIGSSDPRMGASHAVQVRQVSLCLPIDSRGFRLVDHWAQLWGAQVSLPCPEGGPYAGQPSATVRLTRLRFASSKIPDLVFTPWEVSRDLQVEVSQAWPKGVRLVSLADGFGGHALSSREWCANGLGSHETCKENADKKASRYETVLSFQRQAYEAILVLR